MARKPRIHFPGAVYHVILRGNAGRNVFQADQDFLRFYRLIEEGRKRYAHRIHAFCLMPNHVHLVIQVDETPLSRIIQNLSQRYTSWVNRKHEKSGHLFQGRYKAIVIDADSYLLELIRYIHLNPVRAGLVSLPEHYPWSSDDSYKGESRYSWITTDWVLSQFSDNRNLARKRYKKFLYEGLGERRRSEFHHGTAERRILGDDRFLETTLEKAHQKTSQSPDIERIIRQVCRHFKIKETDMVTAGKSRKTANARAILSWLVRESNTLKLTDLSRRLKRDVSGLSRAATLFAEKAEKDKDSKELMEKLKRDLL